MSASRAEWGGRVAEECLSRGRQDSVRALEENLWSRGKFGDSVRLLCDCGTRV